MTTGANTTDYVLDGTMAVQELRNGAVAATYLTGPRGPEYRRDDAAGTVRWYVYDGFGSVVGEAAPDGSLTCTRKLDVYGCVRSSSGAATSKHKFVGSLGHPSDDETGLIYMRARHYDPVTGRFVSEDPALHGMNWYSYCGNNPASNIDEDGKVSLPLWFLGLCMLDNAAFMSKTFAATLPAFQAFIAAGSTVNELRDITAMWIGATYVEAMTSSNITECSIASNAIGALIGRAAEAEIIIALWL